MILLEHKNFKYFEHIGDEFFNWTFEEVDIKFYPDGTQRILEPNEFAYRDITILWKYEHEYELFSVIALAEHLIEKENIVNLIMPYIPNARMDRVKSDQEIFTLKTFCKLINQVGFKNVYVLDAHSNVSLALLDRVKIMDVKEIIQTVLNEMPNDTVLYFPDEGSQKRYSDMFPTYKYVYGMKKRDWETGQIQGLDVVTNGVDIEGKTIVMIDDIISYGGTLYYSALKLKELGVGDIYAYASHTENSILDKEKGKFKKLLDNGTVKKLFTTDSTFTGKHDKIEVCELEV